MEIRKSFAKGNIEVFFLFSAQLRVHYQKKNHIFSEMRTMLGKEKDKEETISLTKKKKRKCITKKNNEISFTHKQKKNPQNVLSYFFS